MDWKNIKTIFIFTFLLLNIYLGIETFEKVNPEYQTLSSSERTNKLEDLTYEKPLPTAPKALSLISGKSTKFTEEDKKAFIAMNSNQEIKIASDTIINSTLIKPYKLSSETTEELQGQLQTFVEDYIPMGENYVYWKHDEARNVYIFQQKYNETPIQFTESINEGSMTGLIEIMTDDTGSANEKETNDDTAIIGYRITNMELNELESEPKIISASNALQVQEIPAGSTIDTIELVYYTVISDEEQFQLKVFMPSWHIKTKDKELYIDASDSSIISIKTNEESEVE